MTGSHTQMECMPTRPLCSDQAHTSTSTVSQHDSSNKRDTRTILNNKDGSPDALQADGFPREATSLWAALGHWEASQGQ